MRCYLGLSHVETATSTRASFDASARRCLMEQPAEGRQETFNPWSIVNVVFHHLADQGLHPILGKLGTPESPPRNCSDAWASSPPPREISRSRGMSRTSSPRSAPRCSATGPMRADPAASPV